jgi:hypothetical protein
MGKFTKSVIHPLHGFMRNKLPLFLCALIAPEYILGWAIRQYLKAEDMKQNGGFLHPAARRLLNSLQFQGGQEHMDSL